MPYVRRLADGRIESLHREPVAGADEVLDPRHPSVADFLGRGQPEASSFNWLDAEFVRVIEDVIDTLIVKNVINITDLPTHAQAKLLARRSFRERVSRGALGASPGVPDALDPPDIPEDA